MLELGPPGSDIVRLKHFEDESFSDIARRLEMPLGSVKTHYYRALEKLRLVLEARHRTGREGVE